MKEISNLHIVDLILVSSVFSCLEEMVFYTLYVFCQTRLLYFIRPQWGILNL